MMRMPRNFSWLIQGEIAGMARPMSMVADLEFLKDNGIEAIVSLTEIPLHKTLIEEFGFEYKHIPIPDLASPAQEQIEEFVFFVNNLTTSKKKIVVHCDAGIGRKGKLFIRFFGVHSLGIPYGLCEMFMGNNSCTQGCGNLWIWWNV